MALVCDVNGSGKLAMLPTRWQRCVLNKKQLFLSRLLLLFVSASSCTIFVSTVFYLIHLQFVNNCI